MIALYIAGGALFLLGWLMVTRIRVRVRYGAYGLRVNARIGPVRPRLLPQAAKKKEKRIKPKEKKEKKKREGPAFGFAEIKQMLPGIKRAAKRLYRGARVDRLLVYAALSGPDPGKLGQNYGYAMAVAGGIVPMIERSKKIKKSDLRLTVDFRSDKSALAADVSVSVSIGAIVYAGLTVLGTLLKARGKKKKEVNK